MKKKTVIIISAAIFVTMALLAGIGAYIFFAPNTDRTQHTLIIPKNANFQQVIDSLKKNNIIKDHNSFKLAAQIMKYEKQVKCGKYHLDEGENNHKIIRRLRRGQHTPVKFTFNNIRTKEQLAEKTDGVFFFESADFYKLLNDSVFLSKYGFNSENCLTGFIPNTYEIFYDITAEEFFEKMMNLYDGFWQGSRSQEAEEIGLSKIEVSILASIVEEENHRNAEKAIIAGLYMNRLHKGMNLCADPTVKYAVGDFTLKRILNSHLEIDSPYNTYKYAGLPPGPIRIPEISTIDSVLHYSHHNYLYMCAKEDFSGYHNFAASASQHAANAAKYHKALNRLQRSKK